MMIALFKRNAKNWLFEDYPGRGVSIYLYQVPHSDREIEKRDLLFMKSRQ